MGNLKISNATAKVLHTMLTQLAMMDPGKMASFKEKALFTTPMVRLMRTTGKKANLIILLKRSEVSNEGICQIF
jgi:hypothetical protein